MKINHGVEDDASDSCGSAVVCIEMPAAIERSRAGPELAADGSLCSSLHI